MDEATQAETITLRVERRQPHVALVTLDRPQVMNAIDSRLAVAIEAAVRALDADPDVRVVVLTGAGGRAFCAGADLKEMVADPSAKLNLMGWCNAGNHVGPSADMFDGAEAVAFARNFNDTAHREIAKHPDRFAAFAHLPMNVPEAAADELERTVRQLGFKGALISGTVKGAFLDDRRFAPVLGRAEQLNVPIYVHP